MRDEDPAKEPKAARRRRVKKASPEYLERAALFHLERYPTTSERLRQLLSRRVARSAQVHGTCPRQGADAIEALIAKLTQAGYLDDAAYARGRAATLHRRGTAARAIAHDLASRGIASGDIEAAIAALKEESAVPELASALAYARRRGIGCYRPAQERGAHRQKDLAALGRRGFSYGLAQRIVEAEDPGELEAEAEGEG